MHRYRSPNGRPRVQKRAVAGGWGAAGRLNVPEPYPLAAAALAATLAAATALAAATFALAAAAHPAQAAATQAG